MTTQPRNLGRKEFQARLRSHARGQRAKPVKGQPWLWRMVGFVWFYIVLTMARKKDYIAQSLSEGTLNEQAQFGFMAAMAALIAASLVVFGIHLVRYVGKARMARNSGGLISGAVMASGLIMIPPEAYDHAFNLLDDNTRSFLETANANLDQSDLDFGNMILLAAATK